MKVRPMLDAMIPLRSWGLKRGDDGWKCYYTGSDGTGHNQNMKMQAYVSSSGVHRGSHGICEQVELPSGGLHKQHASEGVDRGLLEDVVVVRDVCGALRGEVVVAAGAGDEVLITLDGHGGFVVGVVG